MVDLKEEAMVTHEDYVPRFKVGDKVWLHRGFDHESRSKVTSRHVHRRVRDTEKPDTFYTLERADGHVTTAWEFALQPVEDWVIPGVALERVVDTFRDRLQGYRLYVHGPRVDFTLVTRDETAHIRLSAELSDGKVNTCDAWSWSTYLGHDKDNVAGTADNLGEAVVKTYNGSLPAKVDA